MVSDLPLNGKIVLVPGASRPIGRHIARRFAEKGATLILPWLDWPDSVEDMQREFSQADYTYLDSKTDLRNQDEVRALVEKVDRAYGRLDYLINNIERGGMPVVHGSYDHEHNRDQWDLEFSTTLKAKWNLFHCFSHLMLPHEGGAVVNISSIAAITGRSGAAAPFFNDGYSTANRGVQGLTESWAREAAPTVRVNELMLGLIRSRHGENTRGWSALSNREKAEIFNRIPIQRTGREEEVAEMVYFLAVCATYMTGSVIRMDGGYVVGGDRIPNMPPGIL